MMVQEHISLRQFLLREEERNPSLPKLVGAMEDIVQATRKISYLIDRGALGGSLGSANTDNVQGEIQKKLDVISNEVMLEALEWSGHWAGLASEEMEDAIAIPAGYEKGQFLCLFDPLDGSSNIDINGNVGTIFSILPCPKDVSEPSNEDFLQPGVNQIASGFALYGPSTILVLTIGNGAHGFTLDKGSGEYLLTHPNMRVREEATDFTVNMANHRYWAEPMKRYVNECMQGTESERGIHFNMRWAGAMVFDVHRVLCTGGIFMYPWDSRDPDKPGKLRLMYEVNPMSFIIEQAGGGSSTGTERAMEVQPTHLHQRCPSILGSKNEVERVVRYHLEAEQ